MIHKKLLWLVVYDFITGHHLNAFLFHQGGRPESPPYKPDSYASETRYDSSMAYNNPLLGPSPMNSSGPPKTGGEAQSYYNPHT